jgi:DNA repair exonuclease SbcCD nuclease subunit
MGFKLYLGDELIKEYEGDHQLVTRISLNSAQGEAGVLAVPNSVDTAVILVTIRDTTEELVYSDMMEQQAMEKRAEAVEKASVERAKEGRKLQDEMDKKAAADAEAVAAAAAPPEETTKSTKKEPATL